VELAPEKPRFPRFSGKLGAARGPQAGLGEPHPRGASGGGALSFIAAGHRWGPRGARGVVADGTGSTRVFGGNGGLGLDGPGGLHLFSVGALLDRHRTAPNCLFSGALYGGDVCAVFPVSAMSWPTPRADSFCDWVGDRGCLVGRAGS